VCRKPIAKMPPWKGLVSIEIRAAFPGMIAFRDGG
jgi:hypothetical protein